MTTPRRRPSFDLSINLGHLITIAVTLLGLWGASEATQRKIAERLVVIETQLQPLWNAYTAAHARNVADTDVRPR